MRNVDSEFWLATKRFTSKLSDIIDGKLDKPVKAYLAGDGAWHYYTGECNPTFLDLSFSQPFLISQNLHESYLKDGIKKTIKFNFAYNLINEFVHHEYSSSAVRIGKFGDKQNIELYVISPIDLAVSKICSPYSDNYDINKIAIVGQFNSEEFMHHALECIDGYIGVKVNLKEKISKASVILNYER